MRKGWLALVLMLCCNVVSGRSYIKDSLSVFRRLDSTFRATNGENPAADIALVARMDAIAELLQSDTLRLKTIDDRARLMSIIGYRDKAEEEYYKLLRLAEQLHHPEMQVRANYKVGCIHQQRGDLKASTKYLKRAYELSIENGIYADTSYINSALAENVFFSGSREEGIRMLRRNAQNALSQKQYVEAYAALETLAFAYSIVNDYEKSLSSMKEALPIIQNISSMYHRSGFYVHMAEMSEITGRRVEAQVYLDSAFKYAKKLNSAEWLYECYKVQSRIAGEAGKYKEAMNAYEKYSRYKDSVFQKDYNNKIAAMAATYELEKKQSQISLLEKDRALRDIKIRQQKMERNTILLVSALLIVILLAAFRGWMIIRTKNLQKTFSRTLLKIQEEEKERIASELHDSIGQNILFIKNQINQQADDERKERLMSTISDTIEEVRTISKELYPNQLEKYGLAAAVNTLANKTTDATGIFVSASIEEIEAMLTKESKINCYRIIQESITNAVKHAKAKAVRITGGIHQSKIVLTILDNGMGFDMSSSDKKAQSSFGLLSMEARAKILNGKMEMETSPTGTKVVVTFPIGTYAA